MAEENIKVKSKYYTTNNPQPIEQPDWELSDSAKANYVKNKPFGDITEFFEVLNTPNLSTIGTINNKELVVPKSTFTFNAGETYRVICNRNEYICKARLYNVGVMGIAVIGNKSAPTDTELDPSDLNAPFYITRNVSRDSDIYMSVDGGFSCEFILHKIITTVKQIDKKYLPMSDIIPSATTADTGKVLTIGSTNKPVWTDTRSDWNQSDPTAPDYIKNRIGGYYKTIPSTSINWDGVIGDKENVSFAYSSDTTMYFVKVSDQTFSKNELIGSAAKIMQDNNESSSEITAQSIQGDSSYSLINDCILIINSAPVTIMSSLSFSSTGTYFMKAGTTYTSSLTFPEENKMIPIDCKLTNIQGGYDATGSINTLCNYTISSFIDYKDKVG